MEALLALIVPSLAATIIQALKKAVSGLPTKYLPAIITIGAAVGNATINMLGIDVPLLGGDAGAVEAGAAGLVGGLVTLGIYQIAKRVPFLDKFFGST